MELLSDPLTKRVPISCYLIGWFPTMPAKHKDACDLWRDELRERCGHLLLPYERGTHGILRAYEY